MTFVKKDNLEYLEASSQEQETCLTLQEHDDDDEKHHSSIHLESFI
jgi:hypothetical protein